MMTDTRLPIFPFGRLQQDEYNESVTSYETNYCQDLESRDHRRRQQ